MIDLHSHILPGMDDGSKSVEESLQLLDALREQGIRLVVATPHFYADQNDAAHFLERRQAAWQRLWPNLPASAPEILLGAEVHYYEGIQYTKDLPSLCLQGTDVLLLEMPVGRWTGRMLDAVEQLHEERELTVLLAHIERYMADQPGATWKRLRAQGIQMQCNASFFLNWRTKHKALKMLKAGQIQAVCSDCHNMTVRPPRMGEAMAVITKSCGSGTLRRLEHSMERFLPVSGGVL